MSIKDRNASRLFSRGSNRWTASASSSCTAKCITTKLPSLIVYSWEEFELCLDWLVSRSDGCDQHCTRAMFIRGRRDGDHVAMMSKQSKEAEVLIPKPILHQVFSGKETYSLTDFTPWQCRPFLIKKTSCEISSSVSNANTERNSFSSHDYSFPLWF